MTKTPKSGSPTDQIFDGLGPFGTVHEMASFGIPAIYRAISVATIPGPTRSNASRWLIQTPTIRIRSYSIRTKNTFGSPFRVEILSAD